MEGKVVSINRDGSYLLFLVMHQDGEDYWLEQVYEEPALLGNNQVVVVDGYYSSQSYIIAPAVALTNEVQELDPNVFLAHKELSKKTLNELMRMHRFNNR